MTNIKDIVKRWRKAIRKTTEDIEAFPILASSDDMEALLDHFERLEKALEVLREAVEERLSCIDDCAIAAKEALKQADEIEKGEK